MHVSVQTKGKNRWKKSIGALFECATGRGSVRQFFSLIKTHPSCKKPIKNFDGNSLYTMFVHFELALVFQTGLPEYTSWFITRLGGKPFPEEETDQLQTLNEVCLHAYPSADFFLINGDATSQWLRSVIGYENLVPEKSILPFDIIIHTNIVPFDPFSPRMGAVLECHSGKHRSGCSSSSEQPKSSKKLMQAEEIKLVKTFSKGTGVSLISWKGGRFIRKEGISETEFGVVQSKSFSHPHIVYGFCQLVEGNRISYFMEYMAQDLSTVIIERLNRTIGDKPAFSPHDSINILLQIAKAMRHMHGTLDIVHCDLKSDNILICEIANGQNQTSGYLVKVADFGSARLGNSRSGSKRFEPGNGTTAYTAPEALLHQKNKAMHLPVPLIEFPHKIDVYSFGIMAFEVLTGDRFNSSYRSQYSPKKFKEMVIRNATRPLLREECSDNKEFIQDTDLIQLVEECWHHEPSQRPSFVTICEKLDEIKVHGFDKTNSFNLI